MVREEPLTQESDGRPRFVREAERRAAREGKTVGEILAGDEARLHATHYPGPDCLDPEDVQALLGPNAAADTSTRAESLLGHVEGCDHCATLLMLAEPRVDTLEAVLGVARERARPAAAAAVAAPVAEPDTPVMVDVACAAAPSLVALTWISARLLRDGADGVAASLTWLVVATVVLALGALRLSRLASIRRSAFRHSLGALAAGLAVAAAWLSSSSASARQLTTAQSEAFALAKDTAKEQVFDLLQARQTTRHFPRVASFKRPLFMEARSLTDQKAVYVAAEKWLPGDLVAEVTPASGELRLRGKDQDPDLVLSRFMVGRVTALEPGTVALQSAGTTYTLNVTGLEPPAEGSDVIAATDATGRTALSFRPLAAAPDEKHVQALASSR